MAKKSGKPTLSIEPDAQGVKVEEVTTDGVFTRSRRRYRSSEELRGLFSGQSDPDYVLGNLEALALDLKANPPQLPDKLANSPERDVGANIDELLTLIADARVALDKNNIKSFGLHMLWIGKLAELVNFRITMEAEVLNDRRVVGRRRAVLDEARPTKDDAADRPFFQDALRTAIEEARKKRSQRSLTEHLKRLAEVHKTSYERFRNLTQDIFVELGFKPYKPRQQK